MDVIMKTTTKPHDGVSYKPLIARLSGRMRKWRSRRRDADDLPDHLRRDIGLSDPHCRRREFNHKPTYWLP